MNNPISLSTTITRVDAPTYSLYLKGDNLSIKSTEFTPTELRVIADNIEALEGNHTVPPEIRQAEYRCCLKAGMSHEAALKHMKQLYPSFIPETI